MEIKHWAMHTTYENQWSNSGKNMGNKSFKKTQALIIKNAKLNSKINKAVLLAKFFLLTTVLSGGGGVWDEYHDTLLGRV